MLALRVKTGVRPEEAYGMQVGDIDLGTKTIRIERAVSLGDIRGGIGIQNPSLRLGRRIRFPSEKARELGARWFRFRNHLARFLAYKSGGTDT